MGASLGGSELMGKHRGGSAGGWAVPGLRGSSPGGSRSRGGGRAQHRALCLCLVEEWVRPVMKRDKQVLLHWGYYPDR